MKEIEKINEFIESKGKYFHLRLFKYFSLITSTEELREIEEGDMTLSYEFPEGKYRITYSLLLARMKEDVKEIEENNDLKIDEVYGL
jgi:hypothetical protein